MKTDHAPAPRAHTVLADVFGDLEPTPLMQLTPMARAVGIGAVFAKVETTRPLGSFKSLGGTFAAISAVARAIGRPREWIGDAGAMPDPPPHLICASDGNHGLAVAAGARHAGVPCTVVLHGGVPEVRVKRIQDAGASVKIAGGTYDDAVDMARMLAAASGYLLIPDTSLDPEDPVVADVMAGYAVITDELKQQFTQAQHELPTHVFVQAGVGGLAAAIIGGLQGWLAAPARVVIVEPDQAPCVALAMAAGRPVRAAGDLETSADMLSCGEASAPALKTLREYGALCMTVSEAELSHSVTILETRQGIITTSSGAAGLAALSVAAADPVRRKELALTEDSRVLVLITEARPTP
ncbi:pyridoxal-phosphate dependent enzyme [Devosia sp. 63-57]|uniref:pyridoxal-phosphate dependent enzyme n=1 Tax=Devosia sp. 63-57 TaxID=1895751 RepID=UPI002580ED15|nr:pyridoxal-phosphate dependent enzyme [Devosia sp. 63-57]